MPLQGIKGLDVLFLLCGFFAALTLVPALERPRSSLPQASATWIWPHTSRALLLYKSRQPCFVWTCTALQCPYTPYFVKYSIAIDG